MYISDYINPYNVYIQSHIICTLFTARQGVSTYSHCERGEGVSAQSPQCCGEEVCHGCENVPDYREVLSHLVVSDHWRVYGGGDGNPGA